MRQSDEEKQKTADEKDQFAKAFWTHMTDIMKERGLNYEEVSVLAGMSHTWASTMARGKRPPSYLQLRNLSNGLRVPLSALVPESHQPREDRIIARAEALDDDLKDILLDLIDTFVSSHERLSARQRK